MAQHGDDIVSSPRRAVVDDLLIKGMSAARISRYMREMYGDSFTDISVARYRTHHFKADNGVVSQIIKAAHDLADRDPPPTSDREILSQYFAFKQTHTDLAMVYERVRVLKELADKYPFDESYDKRICALLNTAEAIRTRVFRHQYEQVRRAILLNVGKKIVMAAINVFLPYVKDGKRKEAVEHFEAIVKPLLGITAVPDEPSDIVDIKREMNEASKEPEMPLQNIDPPEAPPEGAGQDSEPDAPAS